MENSESYFKMKIMNHESTCSTPGRPTLFNSANSPNTTIVRKLTITFLKLMVVYGTDDPFSIPKSVNSIQVPSLEVD